MLTWKFIFEVIHNNSCLYSVGLFSKTICFLLWFYKNIRCICYNGNLGKRQGCEWQIFSFIEIKHLSFTKKFFLVFLSYFNIEAISFQSSQCILGNIAMHSY